MGTVPGHMICPPGNTTHQAEKVHLAQHNSFFPFGQTKCPNVYTGLLQVFQHRSSSSWQLRGAKHADVSENASQGFLGLQKHDMKSHHCSIKIKCQRHVTHF